jgi:hypothetical protein
MRDKYIDEAFPTWFEMGVDSKIGMVDVTNSNDYTMTLYPSEARELIEERLRLQEVLYFLIGDDYEKYEKAVAIYKRKL